MRKNLLALSIAAMVGGLSGAANAQVAPQVAVVFDNASDTSYVGSVPARAATTLKPTVTGVGHILVTPYFTTQGAKHSLLSITNTDLVNGKAVKLRYRGASNSDDVFDITVFLSPGDVWTADVAADAAGFSRLVTDDNSCTLPSKQDIKDANNGRFKVNRVRNSDAAQTREGYIEILNTADIPPNSAASSLYQAIKHNASGVAPCTAATMDAQAAVLTKDTSANAPVNRGYSWPTGGLFANWIIVDVTTNASFSGEAVALRAEDSTGANAAGNVVWFPQTSDNVTADDAKYLTADPLLKDGTLRAARYDFPDLSTPYTTIDKTTLITQERAPNLQAIALADALETQSITNEYLTAATSGGFATDWVFSMPTRRYAVAMNYAAASAATGIKTNANVNKHFAASNVTSNANWQICVDAGNARGYDREERSKTTFVISPDMGLRFCGETSVLSFNSATSAVLGAQIATQQIQTSFADGWFTLNTPGASSTTTTPVGLPVIGYAAAKANSGNLGGTWVHRTVR